MLNIGIPVLIALAVWWLSTTMILVLDSKVSNTYPRSMIAATTLLALALYGVRWFRNDLSALGAYAGFACSIVVWSWLEMSFLMGFLTGPRKHACPVGCGGFRHFGHAIQAIVYHEIAIIVLAVAVFALGRGGGNQVAAEAMAILWAMRVSAKLNLFLGVRNLSDELLPPDRAYLKSFFRRRPMNFLFPLSVTAGGVLTTLLVQRILAPGAGEFEVTAGSLLATVAVLGVLEHWILVLPFPAVALWTWGLRSREAHG